MSSRGNVAKRGATWTYYVYVTGGDGRRRQVSKGGFRTRKDAEAARVEALNAMRSGTWVRPERITVREFLEDWSQALRGLGVGGCGGGASALHLLDGLVSLLEELEVARLRGRRRLSRGARFGDGVARVLDGLDLGLAAAGC